MQKKRMKFEEYLIHFANIVERKVIHHLDVGEDQILSALCVIKWDMKLLYARIGIKNIVMNVVDQE